MITLQKKKEQKIELFRYYWYYAHYYLVHLGLINIFKALSKASMTYFVLDGNWTHSSDVVRCSNPCSLLPELTSHPDAGYLWLVRVIGLCVCWWLAAERSGSSRISAGNWHGHTEAASSWCSLTVKPDVAFPRPGIRPIIASVDTGIM